MIVTTSTSIKIETGSALQMHFLRSSEHPGCVQVTIDGNVFQLPGNKEEAEMFIAAYRRCINHEIGYRKREVER
jgi:hypothetical protein